MTLITELFKISSGGDDDQASHRTFVTIQGSVSFAHPIESDKFYGQMISMDQFGKLLEKNLTEAFARTVDQFVSNGRVPLDQRAQNWRDDYEGNINITNTAVRGEH